LNAPVAVAADDDGPVVELDVGHRGARAPGRLGDALPEARAGVERHARGDGLRGLRGLGVGVGEERHVVVPRRLRPLGRPLHGVAPKDVEDHHRPRPVAPDRGEHVGQHGGELVGREVRVGHARRHVEVERVLGQLAADVGLQEADLGTVPELRARRVDHVGVDVEPEVGEGQHAQVWHLAVGLAHRRLQQQEPVADAGPDVEHPHRPRRVRLEGPDRAGQDGAGERLLPQALDRVAPVRGEVVRGRVFIRRGRCNRLGAQGLPSVASTAGTGHRQYTTTTDGARDEPYAPPPPPAGS